MNLRTKQTISNINTNSINIKNKIKKKYEYKLKGPKKVTKIHPKTPIADKYIKKETINDKVKILLKKGIDIKKTNKKKDEKKQVIELSKIRFKEYLSMIDFSEKQNVLCDIYEFLYFSRTNYDYDYAFNLIVKIELQLDEITKFFGLKEMIKNEKKDKVKIKPKMPISKNKKEKKIETTDEFMKRFEKEKDEFMKRFEKEKKIASLFEMEI